MRQASGREASNIRVQVQECLNEGGPIMKRMDERAQHFPVLGVAEDSSEPPEF